MLAVSFSVAFVACKGEPDQPPKPTPTPQVSKTISPPAGQPTTATAPLSADDSANAKSLLQERCTKCHTLERVEKATFDRAGWEKTIDRMMSKGAKINAEERKTLIDFLAAAK
jgi:hypothetical protein